MKPSLFIGILSGTSMDAIDVALVTFDNAHPQLKATLRYPIPTEYRTLCLKVSEAGHCNIDEYCTLDVEAGEWFAKAVLALLKHANVSQKHIRAIGSHGQNIRHRPDLTPPFTLQIGDPNIIAERTGIVTVADFRRRDIAAGGQGAPLAPGFHASVFQTPQENRVIVNIGGISNITILPIDPEDHITGFDTGPGNCLMDAWIGRHLTTAYDTDGQFAASGTVHTELLKHCLSDVYFSRTPPKSTGREYFNMSWVLQHMSALNISNIPPQDVQATLLRLTAQSIADAILAYAPSNSKVFVCGGGAHNRFLIQTLSELLKNTVESTNTLGVHPDWVEAMLFAWLAKQTLEGKAGNCPSVTGAHTAIPLGGVFGFHPDILNNPSIA